MNKTRLEILCRRRDALWDKLIDARANDEDIAIINLYKEEINDCEVEIHNMLYREIQEERKNDMWMD